jgi:hypothetical protein
VATHRHGNPITVAVEPPQLELKVSFDCHSTKQSHSLNDVNHRFRMLQLERWLS